MRRDLLIFLDVEIFPGQRKMIADLILSALCHHPDLRTCQVALNDSLLLTIVDLLLLRALLVLITSPEALAAIAKPTPGTLHPALT